MAIKSQLVQHINGKSMRLYSAAHVFAAGVSERAVRDYVTDMPDAKTRVETCFAAMQANGHVAHVQPFKDGSMDVTFRDQSTIHVTRDYALTDPTNPRPNSTAKLDMPAVERVDEALQAQYVQRFRDQHRAGGRADEAPAPVPEHDR
jgi:hypothetical protein